MALYPLSVFYLPPSGTTSSLMRRGAVQQRGVWFIGNTSLSQFGGDAPAAGAGPMAKPPRASDESKFPPKKIYSFFSSALSIKSVSGLLYRFRSTGAGCNGSASAATGTGAAGEIWIAGIPTGTRILLFFARSVLRTAKENTRAVIMKRQIEKSVVIPAIMTRRLSCITAHPPITKRIQNRTTETFVVPMGLVTLRVRFDSSPEGNWSIRFPSARRAMLHPAANIPRNPRSNRMISFMLFTSR